MMNHEITDVVAALIRREETFMICQRPPHKSRGGQWEFVGGKVEPGESLEEALVRECREEMDITVRPVGVFMQVRHTYPDIQIRLTLFNAEIVDGEPKLLEHQAIRWIKPSQAGDYTFCPADDEIINRILKESESAHGKVLPTRNRDNAR